MGTRTYFLVTVLSIAITLVAAFIVDRLISPREQFIAAPFAIPLLIAAHRLSSRGIVVTSLMVLAAASLTAYLDGSPLVSTFFEMFGLLAVGYLGLLFAAQRQVTTRRAYEAEVQRARMQTVFDSAANAIAYVDAQTGRLNANPETTALFGRRLVPEVGPVQLVGSLRRPNGQPLLDAELPSSRALRGTAIAQEEVVVVRPDGREVPVLESATPVHDHGGAMIGAVLVFQDITALKELDRLREEWTSVIAHDLRQPITVILGYVDLLQHTLQREGVLSPVRDHIGHVRTSAVRLQKMVSDLLDVSRIEARRLVLECREVDLPLLVQAVAQRSELVNEGHPVRVNVHDHLPPVFVDPYRIEQVLSNLLSNAAKYGYPESEIRVELTPRDRMAEVSVANWGHGIPPDELPRLFSRFYRTAEARGGGVSGLGLGLYIARGLVEAHSGQIWAESVLGEETTFHFTVPVKQERT